ncbi:uncharacterized protein EKO05_0007780 [Ascochyta rabiei]|uniref:uncharacterized protein n=1 Tax=Didymella rabiei TaxID=5454 RepID=UPI00220CD761|nr:uncharacterized protein EKO05_0007780 [Ascochyta rabiei]UPX17426.1 hypothetical protein EKO05_0007780 [Ascochyta rabiei]
MSQWLQVSITSQAGAHGTTSPTDRTAENDYYTVRALPGKGYGCIALQHIPRGTRILTDTPLLSVPAAVYMGSDIEHAFGPLSPEQKGLYLALHSGHGQATSAWPSTMHASVPTHERQRISEQHAARTGPHATLLSLFQTNCMEMGHGAAVFAHASRFNHACNPNACFSWNGAIGRETIHAMRDIGPGEEITLSYCDGQHDKRRRAWELLHYGFVCACPACGDEDDVSTGVQDRLQM